MILKSAEGLWLIAASMKIFEDIDLNEQRPATTRQGITRRQPLEKQQFELYHPMARAPHPETEPHLPHIRTRDVHVGQSPTQTFSLFVPAPTQSPSFRLAQAIFRAKPFPYKYPTFSTPFTHHTFPPMKMEQTEFSEILVYKLQTPVNHPEESKRARVCIVVWGTALVDGRSWVQFPMVSLEFFIDIIPPGALWPSDRNEYQECFLGCKGGQCVRLTTLPP
jgi:hypothetical protein